jgi:hypothetical protein
MMRSLESQGADSGHVRAVLQTAVPIWAADPARYVLHLCLLADLYSTNYTQTLDPADLDRALDVWQHVRPGAPGMSGFVVLRVQVLKAQLGILRADRDHPDELPGIMSHECAELKKQLPYARFAPLLDTIARCAARWSEFAIRRDEWTAAGDALDLAASAADRLVYTVPDDQRPGVVNKYRWIKLDAVSALARSNRLDEAVVRLEASRQRILRAERAMSELDRLLKTSDPALFASYYDQRRRWTIATQAHFLQADPAAIAAARAASDEAFQQLEQILLRIRQIPGLQYFQLGPTLEEIRLAASPDPILYIWTSRFDTGMALMLPDGRLKGQLLHGLGGDVVSKAIKRWTDSLEPGSTAPDAERERALALVGKILEQYFAPYLRDLLTFAYRNPADPPGWIWGPVTLVVSGFLCHLPVHAWTPALIDDQSGRITTIMPLKYAPSARVSAMTRRPPRPDGASRRVLSLAGPDISEPGYSPLRCAALEAEEIHRFGGDGRYLSGAAATRAEFLANAAKYEVLHLCCHGAEGKTVAGARLLLADGPLVMNDLAAMPPLDNVALAVVSACWSGQADWFNPEESTDIGSLLLAAGARAVVANLWPVDDFAAALFVSSLFWYWDWGAGLPLPSAADAARRRVKEITVAELKELTREQPHWQPHTHRYTRFMPEEMKRFGEPYYWAAFSYSGA